MLQHGSWCCSVHVKTRSYDRYLRPSKSFSILQLVGSFISFGLVCLCIPCVCVVCLALGKIIYALSSLPSRIILRPLFGSVVWPSVCFPCLRSPLLHPVFLITVTFASGLPSYFRRYPVFWLLCFLLSCELVRNVKFTITLIWVIWMHPNVSCWFPNYMLNS